MTVYDSGLYFTENGTILQISYAQKAADNGNTVVVLKSKHGIAVVAEKPIESNLFIQERNYVIDRINDDIFVVASGIQTDQIPLSMVLRRNVTNIYSVFNEKVSAEKVCELVSSFSHQFTRYDSARVLGINVFIGVRTDEGFRVITTDCSGLSRFYKANAIGKGACMAKTELEKLSLDDMSVEELVENGIKTIYKVFDPLKDKPFDTEVVTITKDEGFRRLEKDEYKHFVEMYKDINADQ